MTSTSTRSSRPARASIRTTRHWAGRRRSREGSAASGRRAKCRGLMVSGALWASLFTEEVNGQPALRAMPLLLVVLCVLAIAYRYYSAFLAAKVAALDDRRVTPAHQFNDGQ